MVDLTMNTPDLWKKALPLPNKDSHKHNRGHLLISGSRHMTGASRLTAAGARRMGCGLVYLAVPNEVVHVYMADTPGNIIIRAELRELFARLFVLLRQMQLLLAQACAKRILHAILFSVH